MLLKLLSTDKNLVYNCMIEPTIKKVITNHDSFDLIKGNKPHDGFLLQRLFFAKSII